MRIIVEIDLTKEFKEMQADIAALKAKVDEKFGVVNTALTNIAADIKKLQASSSLSDEDKAALASIGDAVDALAAAAIGVDDLEPTV